MSDLDNQEYEFSDSDEPDNDINDNEESDEEDNIFKDYSSSEEDEDYKNLIYGNTRNIVAEEELLGELNTEIKTESPDKKKKQKCKKTLDEFLKEEEMKKPKKWVGGRFKMKKDEMNKTSNVETPYVRTFNPRFPPPILKKKHY